MLPRLWGASTKRCKDAGSPDSFTIGATEDAAARSVIAFQKAGGHCLTEHLTWGGLVLDLRKLLGELLDLSEGEHGDPERQPEREEAVDERREQRGRQRDSDRVQRERETGLHSPGAAGRQRQRRDDVRRRVGEDQR